MFGLLPLGTVGSGFLVCTRAVALFTCHTQKRTDGGLAYTQHGSAPCKPNHNKRVPCLAAQPSQACTYTPCTVHARYVQRVYVRRHAPFPRLEWSLRYYYLLVHTSEHRIREQFNALLVAVAMIYTFIAAQIKKH